MRLYVICPKSGQRIYLSIVAEKRSQIEEFFTVRCPFDRQSHTYNRAEVKAEPTFGASIGGAILGGLIGGALAGPLGAILLGGLGLLTGSSAEEEEKRKTQQFYEE